MLVIGINGSPHAHRNTAALLQEALRAAAEAGAGTQLIFAAEVLHQLKTPFCVACENPCRGRCYQGTFLVDLMETLARADGILLASPVYFGEVSAQLKSFWDRTRRLRNRRKLINVAGGALSVGAARFGGQETTLRAIHNMMLIQGMIVVGDGLSEDDAGHYGAAAQQPAQEDNHALKRAAVLGRRVVQVADATAPLRAARADLPLF